MFGKRRSAALVAEFLGAGSLSLLVLSLQRTQVGASIPFFTAGVAGLALTVLVFAFHDSTTGYFNPAVTLALWTARKLSSVAAVAFIVAQLLGGWAAYGIYKYLTNTPIQQIPGKFTWHLMVAQLIGTAIFGFGLAAAIYKRYTVGTVAAFIGLAYMVGYIASSITGYGMINPAVDIATNSWKIWGSLGWGTYVLGSVVGAIVGVNLYDLLYATKEESDGLVAFNSVIAPVTIVSETIVEEVKPKAKVATKTAAKKKPAAKTTRAKK